MITFHCKMCGQKYQAESEKAWTAFKCKKCGEEVTVPFDDQEKIETPEEPEIVPLVERKYPSFWILEILMNGGYGTGVLALFFGALALVNSYNEEALSMGYGMVSYGLKAVIVAEVCRALRYLIRHDFSR